MKAVFGRLSVLQGKFENFHAGKGFHDLPDGLFGERKNMFLAFIGASY